MESNDAAEVFNKKYGHLPDLIELWWYMKYHRCPSSYEYKTAQRLMIVRDHSPAPTVGEGDCEICGHQAGLNFKTVISGDNAQQASVFSAKVCFDCYTRLGSNDKVYEAILAARESRKKPEISEDSPN